jgi:23S rRNA pseudouridine1911/1915/1917 synthase
MSSLLPDEATPAPFTSTTPTSVLATEADSGQRADRFLADHLPGLSRSRVKQFIEEGRVQRDGAWLTQPAEPVRPGVTYTLTPPTPISARPEAQVIPFEILYEDKHLIVLDKPPGLVVHPAPGNFDGTLVNALLAHCGDTLPGIGGEKRPGIVHRLDKDTSGVMVVAKTEAAMASLSALFLARDLDRAYLALCWGMPSPTAGDIEGAIGRDPKDRKRMAVVAKGGKQALTHYRTLGAAHAAVSLVSCKLATGRTHQIRVHLSTSGHPIVGDPVYLRRIPSVAKSLPSELRATLLDFPRQALHAARLGFRHPATGKTLSFETRPPPDMQDLIDQLGLPSGVSGS